MFFCNEADFKLDSDGDRARQIWLQEGAEQTSSDKAGIN